MMDIMPEKFFLDLLDDPKGCCAFSSLCRFCKNTTSKSYVQETLFVGWCNFYLRLVGVEIRSLVDLWDWTNFLALLDGLGREKQWLASLHRNSGCKPAIDSNWDIVQEYMIKESVFKSYTSKGKPPIIRRRFTYWITEILWSLIFRHYFDFKPLRMNRTTVIDYHKAAQSLIKWIKTKVPNCRVVSIPTDLRSGVLLCQLVNAIMPKTIESSLFMDNNDAENVVLYAIEAAREVLGIPALINAKDIADGVTDEKSLITYLALFRSADRMLVRGIRPVVPRRNDCGIGRKIYQCKRGQTGTMAYGFGIRYGEVGKPTEFIVQIDRADKSDVQISIKCTPENEDAPKVRAEPSLRCIGESVYIVSYTPVIAGYYEISVLCDLNHINNSPFKIRVKEPNIGFKCSNESVNAISVDSSKRTLPGDYLLFSDDSRCFANNAELDYISGKGSYRPESLNTVDSGIDSVLYNECSSDHVSLTDNSERGSQARTVTSSPNILSKGGSESSAFSDFDFFEATGHGLDSGEVGVMSHFEVRTPIGSNGPLSVVVTCPAVSIPTPFVSSKTDGDQLIHNVMFLPTEPGTYQIELIWGGKLITGSPYSAIVTEAIASQPMMSDNADLDTFLSEAAKNERKAVLYYSATSGDTRHARRCQYLESILHSEIEHLKLKRIAVDLEIQSDERRQLFSKVNVSQSSNSLPFVFLNEKFLGTFETLIRMHRRGDLKEYIDREFDCFRTFEESDDLVDFKTLREIKTALNALKSPLLSEN